MKTPRRKTPKRKSPKRSSDPLMDAAKAKGDKKLIAKLNQLKKNDPVEYKNKIVARRCMEKCGKTNKNFGSYLKCVAQCTKDLKKI